MDHIGLTVSDYSKAQTFYDAILAPLNAKRVYNFPNGSLYANAKGIFLSVAQKEGAGHREGMHYAFAADNTAQVDAWYEAAIKAGAKDNGKPGPRPAYGPNFYGAFVHDPIDGAHLECCFKEYEVPSEGLLVPFSLSGAKYKVTYFDGRGRGEQIRLFLSELGAKFEDVRVNRDQFVALQKQENSPLAFGSLPLLEEGKFSLVQGSAIMSYLAKKNGVFPSNVKDGQVADSIVMGAEDLRMKMFDVPYTKAKSSKDGKSASEVADIDKAIETTKGFVANTWNGRWAGCLERLLKNNGTGFFVGKSLTHADVAVFEVLDAIQNNLGPLFPGLDDKTTPLLAKFFSDVVCKLLFQMGSQKSRPNIKKYLESRK